MSGPQTVRVDIDLEELAVLMCEANYQITRPPGLTPRQALDAMEEDVREGWQRSARSAVDYIVRMVAMSAAAGTA